MLVVGTPNGAFCGNKWLMHSKTRYSPVVDFGGRSVFTACKRTLRYFWCLILWMLSIGRARHPGPCIPSGLLVSVLSSSMLAGGFLEVIWLWSPRPIS